MKPIGIVVGGRAEAIELDGVVLGPDATAGLGDFSHIKVVFVFDRVAADEITRGARRPRGRAHWPEVGGSTPSTGRPCST
ncbi:MAG TPA: hypothetical protein VMU64_12455 [Acidimicrobiales bacterium]|nr:hypothetical protein [Acidimicrobiales bacterium]